MARVAPAGAPTEKARRAKGQQVEIPEELKSLCNARSFAKSLTCLGTPVLPLTTLEGLPAGGTRLLGLTDGQLRKIVKAFGKVDVDGSGMISLVSHAYGI